MSDRRPLSDSRIIRVALIGVRAILIIQGAAFVLTWWVSRQAVLLAQADKVVPEILGAVASGLAGGIGGAAIGTIITAVIARYGAREATRNLSSNGGVHDGD
mgnify:CR=1 FL=1